MAKIVKTEKFKPQMMAAGDAVTLPFVTEVPTKLVAAQAVEGLQICEVHVGSVALIDNKWEGREVEPGIKVSIILKNTTDEVRFAEGCWYLEVEEVIAPPIQPMLPNVPVQATGDIPQPAPYAGFPPAYAAHTAFGAAVAPEAAPTSPGPVEPARVATAPNPHPNATPNGAQPVFPGQNEVAVCLTVEQTKRTLYVLKGGILHPLEVAGVMGPFERALRNVGINP